jgi:hypothetical protein
VTAFAAVLSAGAASAATTLVVANGTSPATCAAHATYNTISAAVAAASSGDTIQVCAGTYPETVQVNTPGLIFHGNQAGTNPVVTPPTQASESIVAGMGGGFLLSSAANSTTISGLAIVSAGTNGNGHDGVEAFSGSSGLTLTDNVIKGNNNGINLRNPDGTMPATIQDNVFARNDQGGNFLTNPGTGTGVFISNGPANNTMITGNAFSYDSQTAINFAGDASNPSTGLVVDGNTSTKDSTFVVATNSVNALIEGNTIKTGASAPGGYGTGILDYGSNTDLRIDSNKVSVTTGSTGASGQSAIHIAAYSGLSAGTTVTGNRTTGYDYGIRVDATYTSVDVSGNSIYHAIITGIDVASGTSGNVIVGNTISNSASPASDCQDASTGNLTGGTANTWLHNDGEDNNSTPVSICPV